MRLAAFALFVCTAAAAETPATEYAHPWEKDWRAADDRAVEEGRLLYVQVGWDV